MFSLAPLVGSLEMFQEISVERLREKSLKLTRYMMDLIELKTAVIRLVLFYILTLALMLMIVPWQKAGSDASPFVKIFEIINILGAAGIMNFVVLTAALSAMNSQLYISTRMVFSLSRGGFGFAPAKLGDLSKKGVPVKALALSTIGIAIATIINIEDTLTMGFPLLLIITIAYFIWKRANPSAYEASANQGKEDNKNITS